MKSKVRLSLTLIASLVAFVVGGLFMYLGQHNDTTAQAAVVDTYTTDWTATSILVLNRTDAAIPDGIGLGVASWSVNGVTGDGTHFVESWTLPASFPTFNDDGTVTNLDSTAWLGGIMRATNVGQYAYSFSTVAANGSVNNSDGNDGVVKILPGRTGSCGGTDNECISTTGAYGFVDWHDFTTSSSGKERAAGALIPLKWHVTGKVCDTGDCTL
jgi:hypothetical protein